MQRKAAFILLILFIISIFSFVILRSWSLGSEDNFFNSRLRPRLSRSPFLRKILSLRYDGDARRDYLDSGYERIELEIDAMEGEELPAEGVETVVRVIERVTGKPVEVRYSDNSIPYRIGLTDDELKAIVDGNRRQSKNHAYLYLLLASSRDRQAENIGTTYGEDGIVIYMDALKSFVSRNPELLPEYFASTVLHEFGHQIGLGHNREAGCLMNPEVEGGLSGETRSEVVVDFCESELRQIDDSRE